MKSKKNIYEEMRKQIGNAYLAELRRKYADKTCSKLETAAMLSVGIFEKEGLSFSNKNFQYLRDCIEKLTIQNSENLLAINTRKQILLNTKKFFRWLQTQKGFKYRIKDAYIAELQFSNKCKQELKSYVSEANIPPTCEEVSKMYEVATSDLEIVLLVVLETTGCRNGALRTLNIGSIHLESNPIPYIHQNPANNVETKNGYNIYTPLIFRDKEKYEFLKKYVENLHTMGFKEGDPLFPVRKPIKGASGNFEKGVTQLTKSYAKSNAFINRILKDLCVKAKLEKIYKAHSFRHYYAKKIKVYLHTIQEVEACAHSMGHKEIDLLIGTYGKMSMDEKFNIMAGIQKRIWNEQSSDDSSKIEQIYKIIQTISPELGKHLKQSIDLVIDISNKSNKDD